MPERTPSPSGPTLLEVLQRPNPELIDRWAGTTYKNTVSGTDSFDTVLAAEPWTDFTYDAILLAYGDILNTSVGTFQPRYAPPGTPSKTPTTIATEDSVDLLGFAWSANILRAPLKAGAALLHQRLSPTRRKTDPSFLLKPITWTKTKEPSVTLKPIGSVHPPDKPVI